MGYEGKCKAIAGEKEGNEWTLFFACVIPDVVAPLYGSSTQFGWTETIQPNRWKWFFSVRVSVQLRCHYTLFIFNLHLSMLHICSYAACRLKCFPRQPLTQRERERIVAIDFCCVACHVQTMFNACSIRIACLLRNLYSWSNKNENKNIQSEMRTQTHKYMRDVDGNNNTTTTN